MVTYPVSETDAGGHEYVYHEWIFTEKVFFRVPLLLDSLYYKEAPQKILIQPTVVKPLFALNSTKREDMIRGQI